MTRTPRWNEPKGGTVGRIAAAEKMRRGPDSRFRYRRFSRSAAAGDAQFITDSYQNPPHRTPSAAEIAYYQTNVMTQPEAGLTPGTQPFATVQFQAHAVMRVYFSASPEFLSDVQITAQQGVSAHHWLLLT